MTENEKFLKHLSDNKCYEYFSMIYNHLLEDWPKYLARYEKETNRSHEVIISYLISLNDEDIEKIFQDNYWKNDSGSEIMDLLFDTSEHFSFFYPKLFKLICKKISCPKMFKVFAEDINQIDKRMFAHELMVSKLTHHRKFSVQFCDLNKLSDFFDDKDLSIAKIAAKRSSDPKLLIKIILKQPKLINEDFISRLDRETIENLSNEEIAILTDPSRRNSSSIKRLLVEALSAEKLLFNLDLCDDNTRDIFNKKIEIGTNKWS